MYDPAHPFGKKKHPLARIQSVSCTGCGYCALFCVMHCIHQRDDGFYEVDETRCIGCRSCKANCDYDAVTMYMPEESL